MINYLMIFANECLYVFFFAQLYYKKMLLFMIGLNYNFFWKLVHWYD